MTIDTLIHDGRSIPANHQDYERLFDALHVGVDMIKYHYSTKVRRQLESKYIQIYKRVNNKAIKKVLREIEKDIKLLEA